MSLINMMKSKREYTMVPQKDGSDFHHHVRNGSGGVTSQYFCLFSFITIVIVLILAGVATLTATMYYSDEISASFEQFWYKSEPVTTVRTTSADSSSQSWPSAEGLTNGSEISTVNPPQHYVHGLDYNEIESNHESIRYQYHHNHHPHAYHRNSSLRNHTRDENDWRYSNDTSVFNETSLDSQEIGESNFVNMDENPNVVDLNDFREKVAEKIRNFEKGMENFTGIRRAEFVVPIFMLICFLSFFSLISLCCCIMMRRRDSRRRKLFGKLITDLQTGDSKTVLLNHSDLDD